MVFFVVTWMQTISPLNLEFDYIFMILSDQTVQTARDQRSGGALVHGGADIKIPIKRILAASSVKHLTLSRI